MSLQIHIGTKKLQVKLGCKTYKIRNDLLAEAMEYASLIEKGSKTLNDVPATLKSLVTALIS